MHIIRIILSAIVLALVAMVSACGGGGGGSSPSPSPGPTSSPTPTGPPDTSNQSIKLNQLGFYPLQNKVAIVPATTATSFDLVTADDATTVFSGALSVAESWGNFSDDDVKVADFSSFETPGDYRLNVAGVNESHSFTISDSPHAELNTAALKAFYFNRASTELTQPYAGEWLRNAGHPDDVVMVHGSAASAARPEGTEISAPKGWYDAGDYGKYIVNSGISTYTLLAAYEHFPEFYENLNTNIPESVNTVPDILDEVYWNIEWMLTMQDPADGGIYHKLTTLNFSGRVMPDQANAPRYVVQKSTAAALNFAAVMAVASRVYANYSNEFPGVAAQLLSAAESAWLWAETNPGIHYVQPSDVSTGQYANAGYNDEFAWAAAELYITTNTDEYYADFASYSAAPSTPWWGGVMALGWMSLGHHRDSLSAVADTDDIRQTIVALADSLSTSSASAYRVVMGTSFSDFVWGSNSVALNQSMMLIQGYKQTNDTRYLDHALANLDYVLGRNPTDFSFVTGFGAQTPMGIHHRPSDADGIVAPVPGLLAGGPHSGQQDACNYPSNLPAESYLDDWCSYSTNEIAINWNAPLVYVTGALEAILE